MTRRDTWFSTRLKYVADCNRAALPEDTEPDYSFTYVDISNVTQGEMNVASGPVRFGEAPSRARRVGAPGDTVVSTVRTYLRAVATVPEAEGMLVFSTGFAVLHPRDGVVDSRFLSYYLQGDEFVDRVVANSTGVSYPAITAGQLMALRLRLPELGEQVAIAGYLDREVALIDTLIAEQNRLIETLYERRSAVITHAVTKGLRSNVQWSETGVPSLGEIPAHWRLCRIKHVGRAIIGLTYSPDDLVGEGQGGTLVLRSGNIQNGRLCFDDNVYVTTPIPAALRLRIGDILICARNGSARLIGKNAIITDEAIGKTWGAFMAVLRSQSNSYLRWVLNSQVFAAQTGLFATSTINQLTSNTLHNLEIALPPRDEQQAIEAYLDEQASQIDALIAEAAALVALAKERRAALITAAVTGQVDVRGEVA